VIVDMAAEQGGNCELTVPGEVVKRHGVTIIGYTDLPSRLAAQSSQLYATNLRHLLDDMCPKKDGQVVIDFADEVVRGATVVKGHEITWPPPVPKYSAAEPAPAKAASDIKTEARPAQTAKAKPASSSTGPIVAAVLGAAALFGVGAVAPAAFLAHFTVFVLACFVGYMVVWNVTPALHTPLMSVTNAISSIIIIGAILQISSTSPLVAWMAAATVAITSVNIAGGFAVTRRMLEMFRK
jgi:NAD(P) transhydrogenase subunit alpha